jgi:tyrosyl-tRNA synthetase
MPAGLSTRAASINNQRVTNAQQAVTTADLLAGRFLIIRKGRKQYFLVKPCEA